MSPRILKVPLELVNEAWTRGAYQLSKSLAVSGELTSEQLLDQLLTGAKGLYALRNSEGVTTGWLAGRFVHYRYKVFHIDHIYAPHSMFEECWEQLCAFAKSSGAEQIRCNAKPAQERLYRMRFNFQPVSRLLKVDL